MNTLSPNQALQPTAQTAPFFCMPSAASVISELAAYVFLSRSCACSR
jgi:hypothetical protein